MDRIIWKDFNDYFIIMSYNNIKNGILINPKLLVGLEINDIIIEDIYKTLFKCIIYNNKNSISCCDYVKDRLNIMYLEISGKKFITNVRFG